MTTVTQREAAKKNGKLARVVWSSRQRTVGHREGQRRAKSGTKGEGDYYRIVLRPKEQFTNFRTQDVGKPGGLQRLAGRRSTGSWATQAWLISKDAAHVEDKRLIADNKDVADLIRRLGSEPTHERGDIFTAKDRPKVAERHKSTSAMRKAQATRRNTSEKKRLVG